MIVHHARHENGTSTPTGPGVKYLAGLNLEQHRNGRLPQYKGGTFAPTGIMENEVNQANYDELGDHQAALGMATRASSPRPRSRTSRTTTNALQMRIMQNSTLQEELKSKASENKGLRPDRALPRRRPGHPGPRRVTTVYLFTSIPGAVPPILVRAYTVLTLPPVLVILTLVGGRKVKAS